MGGEHEQITLLLKEMSGGRTEASEQLVPLVYDELRRIASRYMQRERCQHTLQPTALVHEAYIKLVDQSQADWKDRVHFFAMAAQMMRHILVDYARRVRAEKRGGACKQVTLEEGLAYTETHSTTMLAVDEALDRLAQLDQRQCRIVELRYFVGLSVEETAEVLQVSTRTVKREWRLAKAWLYAELAANSASAARA
jgi:RNA polymerase sigma factor (TIGR02999 family)